MYPASATAQHAGTRRGGTSKKGGAVYQSGQGRQEEMQATFPWAEKEEAAAARARHAVGAFCLQQNASPPGRSLRRAGQGSPATADLSAVAKRGQHLVGADLSANARLNTNHLRRFRGQARSHGASPRTFATTSSSANARSTSKNLPDVRRQVRCNRASPLTFAAASERACANARRRVRRPLPWA